MLVRHNTKYLEEAVQQILRRAGLPALHAESEVLQKRSRATAIRRLATAGAIAIAAIGIGLGLYFAKLKEAQIVRNDVTSEAAPKVPQTPNEEPANKRTQPTPGVEQPPSSDTPNPNIGKIERNYAKFIEKTVFFQGSTWVVETGHQFESETDLNWKFAWCYTNRLVDGVLVKIDLVQRISPDAVPEASIATSETLDKAGLTDAAAIALATYCTWLDDKKFNAADFKVPGNRNPFNAITKPIVSLDGRTLKYEGYIGSDFRDILAAHSFDVIEIDSLGGEIAQAISAGYWLRQGNKSVKISKDCLSACVLVLAGGKSRTATTDARIGVHRFYSTVDQTADEATDMAQQVSSVVVKYLTDMAIDVELFHAMSSVPSESMLYLPHDQLHKWRLLYDGIDGIEIDPLPDSKNPPESTPVVEKNFTEYQHRDLVGTDIAILKDIEKSACENSCRSKDQCKAYTFEKWNRVCILKTSGGLLRLEPRSVTAIIESASVTAMTTPPLILKRFNKIFSDKEFKVIESRDYGSCTSACLSDERCLAFNFMRTSATCKLLDNPSQFVDAQGIDIGIKQQAPP